MHGLDCLILGNWLQDSVIGIEKERKLSKMSESSFMVERHKKY